MLLSPPIPTPSPPTHPPTTPTPHHPAQGFGGGWARDQILRIMKDSRVGKCSAGHTPTGVLISRPGFARCAQLWSTLNVLA